MRTFSAAVVVSKTRVVEYPETATLLPSGAKSMWRMLYSLNRICKSSLPVATSKTRPDVGEVETLAARQDRDRQFLNFGGGEDEFDVRGRLFEGLQQRVERLLRQHVNFVDDVNLVAAAGWSEADVLPEFAGIINSAVACTVDFQHIDILSLGDGQAAFALVARCRGRAGDAVQRLGQDAGGARLADAACPREQVGVRDPARLQRVDEGRGNVFLPDQVRELLGPVAPGHDRVLGRGCGRG